MKSRETELSVKPGAGMQQQTTKRDGNAAQQNEGDQVGKCVAVRHEALSYLVNPSASFSAIWVAGEAAC